MSISVSPTVAPMTARNVNFTGAAAFAPMSKPDPLKTIKDIKNSPIGEKIIETAKKVINFLKEKVSLNGIKDKFSKLSEGGYIKKGIDFAKNIYDKVVNSEVLKKAGKFISDIVKKTKPVA